jgi:hypothetical protein
MAASKPADGGAAQLALAAACGVAFGIAFDKSRVFQPDVIVSQARLLACWQVALSTP